jgi:hypothetical protein
MLTYFLALQDDVIIPIRGEGLVEGEDGADDAGGPSNASAQGQSLSYALHPNCGIFDDD